MGIGRAFRRGVEEARGSARSPLSHHSWQLRFGMNSHALFVVVATLLTCVALEVAGLCIPRCSDGNSCTKDLCDDDGICVYATELPVQFGCCMTDRDCRHYCTMPKYHCRESRCECVAGDHKNR